MKSNGKEIYIYFLKKECFKCKTYHVCRIIKLNYNGCRCILCYVYNHCKSFRIRIILKRK